MDDENTQPQEVQEEPETAGEEKVEEQAVEAPKEAVPEEVPVEETKEEVTEAPAEEVKVKEEAPAEAAPETQEEAAEAQKEEVVEAAKEEETPEPQEEKAAEEPAASKTAVEEKTEPQEAAEKEKAPKEEIPKKPKSVVPNVKLFGQYDVSEITITDRGLARYINLTGVLVPHSGARHANKWFGKSKLNLIERLMNNMMRTEDYTGKKSKAYKTVKNAFQIIEKKTKSNPVQVLVNAIENSAPKEEVTRLRFGGVSVPKAVDVSPSRRLDIALRNIGKGAVNATFKSDKSMEMCLANELIYASKRDMNSFAVSKKEEMERVAGSAR